MGYNGFFAGTGLSLDVKLFHDTISRMISEPLRNNQYIASNTNDARFKGTEAQLDWRLGSNDRLRLTYAYIDAHSSSVLDQRPTASNSGTAGWLRTWGNGWSSTLFYYGANVLNNFPYERIDLRIAKRLRVGDANLELASLFQRRLDNRPVTWEENRYKDPQQLSFSAELEF